MIFSEDRRPLFWIMLKVAKESDSGADRPMMFSELRVFMEACVVTKRTCAACDGELGDTPIQVKIRGKTVEVCCKDCATRLKEADDFAESGPLLGRRH
jgi:hypothetical protein